jgi:hypothetical protein
MATQTTERIPAAQMIGSAVLLQREAVLLVTTLVERGIAQHRQVNGIPPSPVVLSLQAMLKRAATLAHTEVEERRRSDVREMAAMSPSNKSRKDEIDAHEAASILGCSTRQITRQAHSLGGWGGSQGKPWRFSRAEVETYKAERATPTR